MQSLRSLVGVAIVICGAVALIVWGCESTTFEAQFAYLLDGIVSVDNNSTSFPGRPATFGPLPPLVGGWPPLEGNMTFVSSSACTNSIDEDVVNRIAVVPRGGCSFYTKILHLQAAGAMAVIVGNNEESGLLSMYISTTFDDILIPSMFVSKHTYQELLKYHTARLEVFPQDMTMVSSVILFVLSPLLSLTIVYIFLIIQRYHERVRMRAPRKVVEELPVRVWSESDHGSWGSGECIICLEPYAKNSRVMILPCGHEYHEGCIRRWLLKQKRTCPICNRPVTDQA